MDKRIESLFLKYLNNNCSRKEFDEFFDYISNHESEFSESVIRKIYDDQLIGKKRLPLTLRVAAVIVVLISGAFTLYLMFKGSIADNQNNRIPLAKVEQTARSEYRYLLLSDSTQVWLNVASTLEFPEVFSKKERVVELKGEAYFDVKHASEIPFIINTGKVSTIVIGTAFNIKAYPDQEKVTVSVKRGKVNVKYSDKQVAVLEKGDQISIANNNREQINRRIVKEDETDAWQHGQMIFEDETIGDVVLYLEKTFDVRISVENAEIKNLHISTGFNKSAGIEKTLEILSRLTDCKIVAEHKSYILK